MTEITYAAVIAGIVGVLAVVAVKASATAGKAVATAGKAIADNKSCQERRDATVASYERRAQILEAKADSNQAAIGDLRNFAAEIRVKLEYLHASIARQEAQLERLSHSMARVEQLLNGGLKHE